MGRRAKLEERRVVPRGEIEPDEKRQLFSRPDFEADDIPSQESIIISTRTTDTRIFNPSLLDYSVQYQ